MDIMKKNKMLKAKLENKKIKEINIVRAPKYDVVIIKTEDDICLTIKDDIWIATEKEKMEILD